MALRLDPPLRSRFARIMVRWNFWNQPSCCSRQSSSIANNQSLDLVLCSFGKAFYPFGSSRVPVHRCIKDSPREQVGISGVGEFLDAPLFVVLPPANSCLWRCTRARAALRMPRVTRRGELDIAWNCCCRSFVVCSHWGPLGRLSFDSKFKWFWTTSRFV